MTFLTFDVPSWDNCESAYVSLYDGQSDRDHTIGLYCNNNLPPSKLISSFNEMFIRFQSGTEDPGKGFLLEYSTEVFVPLNSTLGMYFKGFNPNLMLKYHIV